MKNPTQRKTSRVAKIPKSESQFVHARKRARQHFGLELDNKLYKDIIKSICGDNIEGIKSEYYYKQSDRVHHYLVKLDVLNENMEVVFDRVRNSISTFMPIHDGKFYPYYFDRFNNKVNILQEFNCSAINLSDDGEVKNFGGNLVRLDKNLYKFETENLILEMRDGNLVEVLHDNY